MQRSYEKAIFQSGLDMYILSEQLHLMKISLHRPGIRLISCFKYQEPAKKKLSFLYPLSLSPPSESTPFGEVVKTTLSRYFSLCAERVKPAVKVRGISSFVMERKKDFLSTHINIDV